MSALWLTFVNAAAAVPHLLPLSRRCSSPSPPVSARPCGPLDICCLSQCAARFACLTVTVCFSCSRSQFDSDPPPTRPVRVCTCAWLMLILDDIIASSAQRFWEKVFPPDWSIDMTSISKPLIDAAPTVSLTICLINMHVMSTTLTKWSTICDHLKLTIVSGHWSCHLSWHYSHFLTVNFGNYFK